MHRLEDVLLNERVRQTNLEMPHSDYVNVDEFPEQISELLNTSITIQYKDYNVCSYEGFETAAVHKEGELIRSNRPKDDLQMLKDVTLSDHEREEMPLIHTGEFTVLRADKTEPYVFIAISPDYSKIIVNSTEKDENNEYKFNSVVSEVVLQCNEFIGLICNDQYYKSLDENKSVVIGVDSVEPLNIILVEEYKDDTIRLVLGDTETQAIIKGYYDSDLVAHMEEVDMNPNPLKDIDVIKLREFILKGKKLYGML